MRHPAIIIRAYIVVTLFSLLAIAGGAFGAYLNNASLMLVLTLIPTAGIALYSAALAYLERVRPSLFMRRPMPRSMARNTARGARAY